MYRNKNHIPKKNFRPIQHCGNSKPESLIFEKIPEISNSHQKNSTVYLNDSVSRLAVHIYKKNFSEKSVQVQLFDAISLAFAHSGHRISAPSVMKPLPTRDVENWAQMKQSLCQCRSSNEINFAPPMPVIGFTQALHRFANRSP